MITKVCEIVIENLDKKGKIVVSRKLRREAIITITTVKGETKEIRVKSSMGNDIFLSANFTFYRKVINQKEFWDILVPNMMCRLSISGLEESDIVMLSKMLQPSMAAPKLSVTSQLHSIDIINRDECKDQIPEVTETVRPGSKASIFADNPRFKSRLNQRTSTAFIPGTGLEFRARISSPSKSNKENIERGVNISGLQLRKTKLSSPLKTGLTPSQKKDRPLTIMQPSIKMKLFVDNDKITGETYPTSELKTTINPNSTLPNTVKPKSSSKSSTKSSIVLSPSPSKQKYKVQLTLEQLAVMDACLRGQNIFLTGGAGTGKSTLLKHIISKLEDKYGREHVFVTATTGLAACAIGGTTVHQFAGLKHTHDCKESMIAEVGKKSEEFEFILQRKFVVRRWKQARVLVVDEISMMSCETLEMINDLGQEIRKSSQPVGGLQVIFCGDFLQLPPVVSNNQDSGFNFTQPSISSSSLGANSRKRFCFQSPHWFKIIHCSFILHQIFRQQDDERFSRLLEEIRWGKITQEVVAAFQECVGRVLDVSDGILPTRIFTHRKDVDELNNQELLKLPGIAQEYTAADTGDIALPFINLLKQHCPAKSVVKLKIGAQVILVKTIDSSEGLVNGARGVVITFTRETRRPIVRFSNGLERTITVENFSNTMGGVTLAQRVQIPLDLCWAMSVHKSQGTTVDKAELCLRKIFECGQAYVALSRVRSMTGLRLTSTLTAGQVRADPNVVEFYNHLVNDSESKLV